MSILPIRRIPKHKRDRLKNGAEIVPLRKPRRWKIQTLNNIEQLEAIRPAWNKLQSECQFDPNPETDIERYISVSQTTNDHGEPYVLLLSQNDTPRAMLIGRKGPVRIKCKVGYLDILQPSLQCITVTYGGFLGVIDNEACRQILEQMLDVLRRGTADAVVFRQLRLDSHISHMAKTLPPELCRSRFHKINLHWRMSVPHSMDSFLMKLQPKTRSTLKRYSRRLEKTHKTVIEACASDRDLYRALSEASQISSRTYQNALYSGLVDDSPTRARLATVAKLGWLRLHVLSLENKPCAFQLGFKYGKTYFLQQMGFDPEMSRWRFVTHLFLKVLEELCIDPSVNNFDFGFGDAEYKRRYGDENWAEATVYMFAPRAYPVAVNTLHSLVGGISKGMLLLAKRAGLESGLKRKWRNMLQKTSYRGGD
jgi:CelD/BcsL family acetyltransferase involved in cellulose biosynthesis